MKSWRTPRSVKPPFGSEWTAPPATRIFDNVSFIGNVIVGCYVVETGEDFSECLHFTILHGKDQNPLHAVPPVVTLLILPGSAG